MHLCTSLHVVAASRVQNHHNTLGLQEKVSTLSIEHHFCWKSAILSTFMSVAKHSANLLLVVVAACVVVQFSHLLSCMWLGSPSQLWLQESLKRCQGLAAFYCECWHVFLLVGEWSRFIFEPKPPFLPGVWPKSPAGWRGAISPLVGEPQLVRQKVAEKFSLYTLRKLRWLAGKSTMNEDVFSTENGRFSSQSC